MFSSASAAPNGASITTGATGTGLVPTKEVTRANMDGSILTNRSILSFAESSGNLGHICSQVVPIF